MDTTVLDAMNLEVIVQNIAVMVQFQYSHDGYMSFVDYDEVQDHLKWISASALDFVRGAYTREYKEGNE
jgi:hypothetical protein